MLAQEKYCHHLLRYASFTQFFVEHEHFLKQITFNQIENLYKCTKLTTHPDVSHRIIHSTQ